jgi:hypothetical protein
MIVQSRLDGVYGGLTPNERARLMASINRTGAEGVMQKVWASVPDGQATHYNHRLAILRGLHRPLLWNLIALLLAAERDSTAMRMALLHHIHSRKQHVHLHDVWKLVPYPVTEREFAALQRMEQERPSSLDDFASFMIQTYEPEEAEAAGWRAAVVSMLRGDEPDDEAWQRRARALLDAAIGRGELPPAHRAEDGASLPYGVLISWLEPGRTQAPLPPSYHVPTVELLGGGAHERWEIRPESEASGVRQRRDDIADALFGMAGLKPADWPSLHPPSTSEEQATAREHIERDWPWTHAHKDASAQLTYLGTQHAPWRARLAAHHTVLEEVQIHDFCGEDPVPGGIRELLTLADAEQREIHDLWAMAGDALSAEAWPPLPDVSATEHDELLTYFREIYRAME